MNVAEWAALVPDSVGCSVFWIDEGVDTGDIVATRQSYRMHPDERWVLDEDLARQAGAAHV